MRPYLDRRARKPLAVNVRGLRNTGNANQQNAKQRSDTQPKGPRSSAKLALGQSLHATSSMTRFFQRRTQLATKLRILSHYVPVFFGLKPSERASRPGQYRKDLPLLQRPPPQRSGRPG